MLISNQMGFKSLAPQEKLEALTQAAVWDIFEGESSLKEKLPRCWVYPAAAHGKAVPILKVLLSNSCINNCLYCAFRAGRPFNRISFQPEELAQIFWQMYLRGIVEGIFLSSGVAGSPNSTMEKLLDTAEIIRGKYGFTGYLHLKVMPGASFEYVKRAAELASRISINIEVARKEFLPDFCPGKSFENVLNLLSYASKITQNESRSQTTQLIVGLGEKDRDILSLSFDLYQKLNLSRCYFSPFRPVPQTPLGEMPPTPISRVNRLYQADLLLRKYGFSVAELPFDKDGNLPQDLDPKLAWAREHPEFFPVEVNKAGYRELIRVPGIGPKAALSIISRRRLGKIRSLEELAILGVIRHRAAPFILIDGKPACPKSQLSLW